MKKIFISLLFLLFISNLKSQDIINNRVKTQYILSFLRYIDWNNEDSLTVFKIGVYAQDSVMFDLLIKQSKDIKIKRKKVKIVFLKNLDEIKNIQILYSDKIKSQESIEIYNKLKGKQILMVTDGLDKKNETMMNFMPLFYVRVEIHEEALAKEGFFLPSIFKILAKIHKKNYEEMYDMVNDSLGEEREIIKKQRAILENQLKEIKEKEKRILALNDTLNNQLVLVKKKELELNKYSLLIVKKDSVLAQKTNILNQQQNEIANQILQITKTKNKLNAQQQKIKEKEKILQDLSSEIDKQKAKISEQKGALKESYEEIKFQRYINIFIGIVLLLIMLLAIFVYRNYRNKKKANKILELKNKKITQQNDIIQEKNEELNQLVEEVTSQKDEIEAQRDLVQEQKNKIEFIYGEIAQSIDYATRIQESVLPEVSQLTKNISDYFVMFSPKDKVSGDFYWWKNIGNKTIISAADCTGHGVPGAFMSMLGSTFLNEITSLETEFKTGDILNILREKIIETLKQKGRTGEQKDGMDMSLIYINHDNNIIEFSGANNPLYLITNSELRILNEDNNAIKFHDNSKLNIQTSKLLYEIKPDKMPIAIYEKMDSFTTHKIQLEKGDCIFMFSDGYADQFGGPKNKKFKYKTFKKLLVENANIPMAEQKILLEEAFNNWKGSIEQVDDVLVIGIKL